MKKILFLSIAALCASCSCEYQMRRLMYKCPEMFESKNITVPVYVPEYKTDTTFIFSAGKTDTLTIQKDRVVATIIRTRDTLRVHIRVPADTIYREVRVEVPKPVFGKKKSFFDRLGNALTWIAIGVIGAVVFRFIFYKKR